MSDYLDDALDKAGADDEVEFGPELPSVPVLRMEPLSARETMALPEPNGDGRLLGRFLRRGSRLQIAGASGHGKSTLALAMGGAVLRGDECLGEQGAGVGPVLIIDLEQGLRSVKRMLAETGLAERDDVYVVRVPDGLALDSDETHRDELERVIAEVRPVLVILDPYYKAHRADTNEERAVTDLMRTLDGLREAHGFGLVMPAHVRKSQGGTPKLTLTLDDVAGSGAVTRGAEVVLGIERIAHGVARLRFLKDRDGDLPVGEALDLSFTKEHGFRIREAEDLEAKALANAGAWLTVREWMKLLGIGETKAKTLLTALVEAGKAEYEVGPEGRQADAKCWRTGCIDAPMHPNAPPTEGVGEVEGASVHQHLLDAPDPDAVHPSTQGALENPTHPDAPPAFDLAAATVDSLRQSALTANDLGDRPLADGLADAADRLDAVLSRLAAQPTLDDALRDPALFAEHVAPFARLLQRPLPTTDPSMRPRSSGSPI